MAKMMKTVLLVDDEETFLEAISKRIELMGFKPLQASSSRESVSIAQQNSVDITIVDFNLPDFDGLVTLTRLKEVHPNLKTVILTGYGNEKVKRATEALNSAYFEKDDMEEFWKFIRRLTDKSGKKRGSRPHSADKASIGGEPVALPANPEEIETAAAGRSPADSHGHVDMHADRKESPDNFDPLAAGRLIGETKSMLELKKDIAKVAVLDCTVLISGETGTGKEVVARAIHNLSPRRNNRILAINCGSFNQELLSNELFGHEKEAFTGAMRKKMGLFESACGGSLLLDEIGDMPLHMQVQLLRVIQEKTILRVGGTEEIPVDVRVLAATHRSLREKVEDGSFREDLYYRLNIFELSVPPLRQRRNDIEILCKHFLDKYNREYKKKVETISDEVASIFYSYNFPGNVRELENIIERAVVLSEGPTVQPKHLPQRFSHIKNQPRSHVELISIAEVEKRHIRKILEATGGNKSKAANILGISRPALWRKLKLMNEESG